MLDPCASIGPELLVIVPVAVLVLLVLIWRGCLRSSVFDDSPARAAGLGPIDLGIGLMIMLAGGAAVGLMLHFLGVDLPGAHSGLQAGSDPDAQVAPELSGLKQANLALLVQAMTELPVVLFLLYRVWGVGRRFRALGVLPKRLGREIVAGALALLAALPLVAGVISLTENIGLAFDHQPMPDVGHEMLRAIRNTESIWAMSMLCLSAVIVAPLLEEGIFRGLVQTCLLEVFGRGRRWAALITAALLFTLIHTQVPWQVLPGLFTLGIVLGWLYERSGSLLPCVLVHSGFNAVNVILVNLLSPPQ